MPSIIRAKIETWIETGKELPKRRMVAGVLWCGLVAGLTMGAFTGPVGMALGIVLGVGIGFVAGYMLAQEEEAETLRHKELDDIIGITRGSMGAGPITMPPPEEEESSYSTKEAWLAEWLTPAPPGAIE